MGGLEVRRIGRRSEVAREVEENRECGLSSGDGKCADAGIQTVDSRPGHVVGTTRSFVPTLPLLSTSVRTHHTPFSIYPLSSNVFELDVSSECSVGG